MEPKVQPQKNGNSQKMVTRNNKIVNGNPK